MPSTNWTEDRRLKPLAIDKAALNELCELLTAAGGEKIRVKFYLPKGEQKIFTSMAELGGYEFQQAIKIGISAESSETQIYIHLSREMYSPSIYTISASDRNEIYIFNGIMEDFQHKYTISESTRSEDFVSFGELDSSLNQRNSAVAEAVNRNDTDGSSAVAEIGISKKIRKMPDELPDAKIYLDDLEEISTILIEAYRKHRNTYDPEPTVVYLVGDDEFRSLSALQNRGGISRKVTASISGSITKSVRIKGILQPSVNLSGLDEPTQWMVYGRIKSIFDSRAYKFKNSVRSLPLWFRILVYIAWLIGLDFVDLLQLRVRVATIGIIYVLLPILVGIELFRRSVVIFSPSHKVSGTWTERRIGYVQNFLFTLLGASLSVLFQAIYDHLKAR